MSDSVPDENETMLKFQEAIAKHQNGDEAGAEIAYKALLEEIPDNPQLNYLIGCLYLADHCFDISKN